MKFTKILLQLIFALFITGCGLASQVQGSAAAKELAEEFASIRKAPSVSFSEQAVYNKGMELTGKVIKVSDGDTVQVRDVTGRIYKIRFDGIDAPEKKQAFGNKATVTLRDCIYNKDVKVKVHDQDRYGRLVATIYHNNEDINAKMLKEGMAWHYKAYNNRSDYAALENEARRARRGLWYDKHPQAPWDYRKQQRMATAKKKS